MNRPRQAPAWTPEEEATLRKLTAERMTLKEISAVMGRTRNAVAQRRYHLRITRPSILDQRLQDEIARRYERGLTNGVIARVLHLEPRVVTYAVRRSGAIFPPTAIRLFKPKPLDGELLRLRAEGFGVRAIAKALGIGYRSASERLTTLDRYEEALEMTGQRRAA